MSSFSPSPRRSSVTGFAAALNVDALQCSVGRRGSTDAYPVDHSGAAGLPVASPSCKAQVMPVHSLSTKQQEIQSHNALGFLVCDIDRISSRKPPGSTPEVIWQGSQVGGTTRRRGGYDPPASTEQEARMRYANTSIEHTIRIGSPRLSPRMLGHGPSRSPVRRWREEMHATSEAKDYAKLIGRPETNRGRQVSPRRLKSPCRDDHESCQIPTLTSDVLAGLPLSEQNQLLQESFTQRSSSQPISPITTPREKIRLPQGSQVSTTASPASTTTTLCELVTTPSEKVCRPELQLIYQMEGKRRVAEARKAAGTVARLRQQMRREVESSQRIQSQPPARQRLRYPHRREFSPVRQRQQEKQNVQRQLLARFTREELQLEGRINDLQRRPSINEPEPEVTGYEIHPLHQRHASVRTISMLEELQKKESDQQSNSLDDRFNPYLWCAVHNNALGA